MPLCLTFIDLKKAFETVETGTVMEALDNKGVPTPCIKILREFYSNFTTTVSTFYNDVIIDVKRRVRQGDTKYSVPLSRAQCKDWNGITQEWKLTPGIYTVFVSLMTSFL